MDRQKREWRELKREIKRTGNQRRRQRAPYLEDNFGRYCSAGLKEPIATPLAGVLSPSNRLFPLFEAHDCLCQDMERCFRPY